MNVVTGAFGYIGKVITRHLLQSGEPVRTITSHPEKPNPFGEAVQAFSYNFDNPEALVASMSGAATLYNTYWIRFEYGGATYQQTVQNTAILFDCARKAGVGKIVHISVTNASVQSSLPYYRGKGQQEKLLIDLGLPYCIVRPTLVFGAGDILVNNIAWLLRRFPIFPIFGSGQYRLQPVYIADLAAIAVAGAKDGVSGLVDVLGPEDYNFEDFVHLIATRVRPGARLIHVPPGMGIALGKFVGLAVGDIILTADELRGLMDGLLTSDQAPNGTTRFSEWLEAEHGELGLAYASELARHFHDQRT